MLRLFAADIIHLIHYVVVLSILLAFAIPAGEWMKYHIIFICLLMLDWNDMDNQCALTALEAKLRGTWKPGGSAEGDDRPAFWQPFLRKIGVDVSRARADRLNYFLFVLSLLVCFLRYCAYKRIRLNFAGETGRTYAAFAAVMGGLWFVNQLWQVRPASA
jgi:hypothetical protein